MKGIANKRIAFHEIGTVAAVLHYEFNSISFHKKIVTVPEKDNANDSKSNH